MNSNAKNIQIRLVQYPSGLPGPHDFERIETECPSPGPGEILCRTLYISLDPGLRGRMDSNSYANQAQLGQVVPGYCLSEVAVSRNEKFHPGDLVVGQLGWQGYALSDGSNVSPRGKPKGHPPTALLHLLGSVGLTAWMGLLNIGQPRPAETVLVSAAAGAVGSAAGQIAKIKGCRAVGIAGSDEKCRYVVNELGFDACVNRKDPAFDSKLRQACPNGVDIYFDNVGGDILRTVLDMINLRARIVLCGMVAEYGESPPKSGPNLRPILMKRASITGFINFDHYDRMPEAMADIERWMSEEKLKYHEDIVEGIENTPEAFSRMLRGGSRGKAMVRV
ncbi:MAG TPA: NADP-dependent oxidoreductase [Sphingomicrobium sp.]|nr:NADP-dependent oxidoreductase [Sphingomicrobium sp.]HKS17759.1 NADP-dependent oxidoreductase [Bradyrhizobium sp.]